MNKGLSREDILKIEDDTENKYGISRLILMENAGRLTAEKTEKICGSAAGKRVCIFCGKGNNGGDGFVAARYLFNMGASVEVFHTHYPEAFTGLSFTNYGILCKMKVKCRCLEGGNTGMVNLETADIVIDALFGTGIKGEITGSAAELIEYINRSGRNVVCADIPSGLEADTGRVCGIAVKGCLTVSYGFAKKGFFMNEGPEYCGKIEVVDIGFPRFFYTGEKW